MPIRLFIGGYILIRHIYSLMVLVRLFLGGITTLRLARLFLGDINYSVSDTCFHGWYERGSYTAFLGVITTLRLARLFLGGINYSDVDAWDRGRVLQCSG